MHELRRDGNERIPASQHRNREPTPPEEMPRIFGVQKMPTPFKTRRKHRARFAVLRRVRLSESSAQIPTVDKQQLDRKGDQPQGAKLQQLAKRVTSSATFWAGF